MSDTEAVVRLLEVALADAVAGQMIALSIELTDQDGVAWMYQYTPPSVPQPPAEPRALQ